MLRVATDDLVADDTEAESVIVTGHVTEVDIDRDQDLAAVIVNIVTGRHPHIADDHHLHISAKEDPALSL